MPLATTQAELPSPDQWVTIDEAARLTGKAVRTWCWRARQEAHEATRTGRQSLAVKAQTPDGRGRRGWYVHRSCDERLSRYPARRSRDERARAALATKYPQHLIDRALRRKHWLQQWRKACDRNHDEKITDRDLAGRIVTEARRVEEDGYRISVRSLYRWRSAGKIEGLIDKYAGAGRDETNGSRSPEAVEYFYDLYHTQSRHSVRVCHEVTLGESRHRGWSWPGSYSATVTWLGKHDDLSLTCLMRDGKDVWARRFLPHLSIDYSGLEPGEMMVCDHHQCDWWVFYKGLQIRPWLTAVQDLRSRCIVGWHLGPTPHQDAILASLRMAFRDRAIPRVMRIDNGRDYTSRLLTGVSKPERDRLRRALGRDWQRVLRREANRVTCDDPRWLGITGELNIDLIYATPYAPWSKGTLERWFGTFEGRHGKTYITYCGNSAVARPECLAEIRRGYTDDQKRRLRRQYGRDWKRIAVLKFVDQADIPTLDEARERIGEYLDIYHRTEHRTLGDTPLAVWNSATSKRRAVEDELAFLMDLRGLYAVGANGVTVKVGSSSIAYGGKSETLKRLRGRKVLVALDPDDIGQCWVFTPDREKRRLIARLEANERIEPYTTADDAREAIAEIKRDQSIMYKAARSAARRTRTAVQRINQHSRAKRAALLATGTDDAVAQARIIPVRTGFEGVSKPSRTRFETGSYRPADSGELDDLFDKDETFGVPDEVDDCAGMEDLFIDDDAEDTPDDGFEGFL